MPPEGGGALHTLVHPSTVLHWTRQPLSTALCTIQRLPPRPAQPPTNPLPPLQSLMRHAASPLPSPIPTFPSLTSALRFGHVCLQVSAASAPHQIPPHVVEGGRDPAHFHAEVCPQPHHAGIPPPAGRLMAPCAARIPMPLRGPRRSGHAHRCAAHPPPPHRPTANPRCTTGCEAHRPAQPTPPDDSVHTGGGGAAARKRTGLTIIKSHWQWGGARIGLSPGGESHDRCGCRGGGGPARQSSPPPPTSGPAAAGARPGDRRDLTSHHQRRGQ